MRKKTHPSSSQRQAPVRRRHTTDDPYVAPDGALTLEEWRRSVAKMPAVHLVVPSDRSAA